MALLLRAKILSVFAILLLNVPAAWAQLTDFVLNVDVTHETCTGNGALTFTTQNTTPGATMLYSVYLLPETGVPIAVLSGTSLTGLTAGDYQVQALQTLGNLSNTQTQNITILNQIVPLTFTIAGTPESCANGTITITAQGDVAFYEIISGPQTFPPQASNVFDHLVTGTYNIRVTDACGDAHVQTYTLQGASALLVTNFETRCQLIDCDTASVRFTIMADQESGQQEIVYPLFVTVTVHPPDGGAPIVITQTITSGDDLTVMVEGSLPFFNGESYTCDISVSDSCGHTFTNNGNVINNEFTATVTPMNGLISGISITACYGMPPYTVAFTAAPDGFDPIQFNPGHPGPFHTLPIDYVATPGNPMPNGTYDVAITDSCGNVSTGSGGISNCPKLYAITPVCAKMGRFVAPDGLVGATIATGSITVAPPDFPHPLPYDLSDYISDAGVLDITLPPGHYIIEGQSNCPGPYEFDFTIFEPTISAEGKNVFGCLPTTGSIELFLVDGIALATVVVMQAPVGFNQTVPYDASGQITPPGEFRLNGLMYGDYLLHVTDTCGNLYEVPVNVPLLLSDAIPMVDALPGCAIGQGSVRIRSANGSLVHAVVLAAPAGYPNPLPHDVTTAINSNGALALANLPEGEYTFLTRDICGVEKTFTNSLVGFHIIANDVQVLGNCGSFDLQLTYSPGTLYGQVFWLQKFNAVENVWEHPFTGIDYTGTATALNSYPLNNNVVNYNIAAIGQFRILKNNQTYSTGSIQWTTCSEVIKEFEFLGQLKINSAYSVPCANGVSQVVIIAGDTFPLTYRITEKDGQPFLVENGNSNNFSGLAPGIYNFQVEDLCGNIANRLFDIVSLSVPEITPHNLCNGQNGYLGVQGIAYLSYQWWNGNDPNTILSTNSTLYFSPFSQETTPGTYYVRIYSTTALSCIDTTLSYTILPVVVPNAGQDTDATLCGSNTAINLFSILGGPFDTNGYWQETTASGMLTGSSWLPIGLAAGIYTFNYRVDGFCGNFDLATVHIELKGAVPTPVITVVSEPCSGSAIEFATQTVLNASYHWTGPQNFVSDVQHPVIPVSNGGHSGTYTVTVRVGECEAQASVNIGIQASPEFEIAANCENGSYVLRMVPAGGAFDPNTTTFEWSGPQGFTASDATAVITGLAAGPYQGSVTDAQGCTTVRTFNVVTTRCSIPTGVSPNNDNKNDTFDLTGFGVLKFKIYNRYGRMIFEQDNYTNQWYGQDFNGNILPDATYYYYIRLSDGEEKTGWVYVTK